MAGAGDAATGGSETCMSWAMTGVKGIALAARIAARARGEGVGSLFAIEIKLVVIFGAKKVDCAIYR
jgi:hypothetical protein